MLRLIKSEVFLSSIRCVKREWIIFSPHYELFNTYCFLSHLFSSAPSAFFSSLSIKWPRVLINDSPNFYLFLDKRSAFFLTFGQFLMRNLYPENWPTGTKRKGILFLSDWSYFETGILYLTAQTNSKSWTKTEKHYSLLY